MKITKVNKKYLITILISLFSFTVLATPLTPEEALARMGNTGLTRGAPSRAPQLKLTFNTESSEPALYLFERPGYSGYFVLSADDDVPALLGYSDNGDLDANNLPPQLVWWLEQYSRQIEWLREKGIKKLIPTRAEEEKQDWESIAPLVSTKWDQEEPYNQLCPQYEGVPMPTGCVATAMAQVMKYYNYPEKGTGSIKYKPDSEYIVSELSMDFSEKAFDWKNMLDTYVDGQYNSTQAEAVAYLMKACGYASEMEYTPKSSGAMTYNQANALVTYFKYDPQLKFLSRDNFTYDEWAQKVYDNLSEGHPVIYGGNGPFTGGHSFVCDGYSEEGYFHFNWGWGGLSDGYFLLDVLDPINQGTGGNIGGFSFNQDILCDIMPMAGDQAGVTPAPVVTQQGSLTARMEDGYLLLGLINEGPYGFLGWMNSGYREISFDLGIILEAISEGNTSKNYYTSVNYVKCELPPYSYYMYDYEGETYPVAIDMNKLRRNGTYKVTLAARQTGILKNDWTPVLVNVGDYNYITLTKNDNDITVSYEYPINNFEITDFNLVSPLYYGTTGIAKAEITNPSDFQLSKGVGLIGVNKEGETVLESDSFLLTLNPGETVEQEWEFSFNELVAVDENQSLELDLYLIDIVNGDIYDTPPVHATINKKPGFSGMLVNLTLNGASQANGVWKVTDPSKMEAGISLAIDEGYFSYPLLLGISEKIPAQNEGTPFLGYLSMDAVSFPGYPYKRRASFSFNADPDITYNMLLSYVDDSGNLNWLQPGLKFVYDTSGVKALAEENNGEIRFSRTGSSIIVTAGAGLEKVTVYDMTGTALNVAINNDGERATINLSGLSSRVILITAIDKEGNVKSYKTTVR